MSILKDFTKGFIKENPVFVLMLGMCPTLATSSSVKNGIGMGLAATFVLACSNVIISAIRKTVPNKIRIPVFIVVVATFTTIVDLFMEAYVPALHKELGVFIPLIVVNCIILARAEMFAQKNPILNSAADGLGLGLGFTLTLAFIGTIREILGEGTWYGMQVMPSDYKPFLLAILAPGGFICLGLLMGLMVRLQKAAKK
ncbi:MAG: electron transport complex subunit E [Planctomycetota bacterium]|nr:electron transport complex subunit E [Planctomycetota bacterium]